MQLLSLPLSSEKFQFVSLALAWLFWWEVDTLSCTSKCFSFHFALQIVQSQGSRSSLFCLQCYGWLPSLPFSGNWSFLSAFNQFSRFKCHHSRLWLFSEATQLFNICSVGAEGGSERLLQAKYINWEKGFRKKAMQKGVDFFFFTRKHKVIAWEGLRGFKALITQTDWSGS